MEEKEFRLFGKNLITEEKEKAANYLKNLRRESLGPIEGELEKTPEELKMIEKINVYLQEEFDEFDIRKKPNIPSEAIHLLPAETFEKYFPEDQEGAVFLDFCQAVFIDKSSRKSKLWLCKTIFHEAVHMASFQAYYADNKGENVKNYRLGYSNYHPHEESHEHLRGLNEAVTDKIVIEIFNKHKEELNCEFGIVSQEMIEAMKEYIFYADGIKILETVIKKMAEKNGVGEEIVWKNFKKGLFTGNLMFLKEVDKIFGRGGALRVLAALGSGTKRLPEKEVNRKILRFFETEDEKEQNKIADEILIERERMKYRKSRVL